MLRKIFKLKCLNITTNYKSTIKDKQNHITLKYKRCLMKIKWPCQYIELVHCRKLYLLDKQVQTVYLIKCVALRRI